jgi:osmoprotectant transport system permease protein
MFAQLLENHGIAVERRPGLGSTEIIFQGLRAGAVDIYPEYTGTGLLAVLHDALPPDALADPRRVYDHVSAAFARRYGMRWLPPLGFENVYAIAVRADTARKLGLASLSDLASQGGKVEAGFTADFIGRPDGLAGLSRAYGLHPRSVRPLSPALKYQALAAGSVDVVDGYSTDGLLDRYHLVVLRVDRQFFPPYEAAALLGPKAAARSDVVAALTLLSGRLDVARMRALNRRIEVEGEPVARVAASALVTLGLVGDKGGPKAEPDAARQDFAAYLWIKRTDLLQLALRHLWLVAIALAAAAVVAIPLGLALERARRASGLVLGGLGILQVIPSIALLAFMVPLLGIGVVPALVALWLYALYPIARGTYSGVRDADPAAVEAAEALGATPRQSLVMVRLPLAAPAIMAGLRTAAVITVGAATLAAFIGAGGLGEPIVEGLALADARMILSGAIPAALLALLIDFGLSRLERRVAPAHLRSRANRS